jgi:hypothetical protein
VALRAVGQPGAAPLPEEIELETLTGWRWFEVTPRLASVGEGGAGVVVTAVDVTDRRRDRTALATAQRRFLGAFADAPVRELQPQRPRSWPTGWRTPSTCRSPSTATPMCTSA